MIYKPAEDSYFLNKMLKNEMPKFLRKNKNLKFLEIGSGNGMLLQTAEEAGVKKQNIFSCDINKESVEKCISLGYNCVKSDLFENLKKKYDLIIFNPPYLPEHEYDKNKDTSGGKKGNEIILKFLKQAKNHLEKEGIVLVLTSSLTGKIDFRKLGYDCKKLDTEKLFYEKLSVWKLAI